MKTKMKLCPRLEYFGVFCDETGYVNGRHEQMNWIKDICRECPIDDNCIYDKAGPISKKDRETLEKPY